MFEPRAARGIAREGRFRHSRFRMRKQLGGEAGVDRTLNTSGAAKACLIHWIVAAKVARWGFWSASAQFVATWANVGAPKANPAWER